MSMKKNALAVALVAGLGLAGVAAAYTIQTNNDETPEKIATTDVVNASTVITMTQAINVKVDSLDFIVGRTTGFNVRVELNPELPAAQRAIFDVDPTVNAGAALPCEQDDGDPNTTEDCWTVRLVAGGAGNNYAVIAVEPPSSTPVPAVVPGEIFNLSNVQLRNLTALRTDDAVVPATARFIDPVGAREIGSDSVDILQSGNPVELSCDESGGDQFATIDVGQSETQGSKTFFSSDGTIGAQDLDTFDFGDIVVSRDAAFSQFAYAPTDSFQSVLTGDYSAFLVSGNSLYLSADDCNSAITANRTVNAANNTVTFTYTAANAGFDGNGGSLAVCGRVANGNEAVIGAVAAPTVRTTFMRTGVPNYTQPTACPLEDLTYNGSVVRVYNVNPAGNSTAQSFVRVINQSSTAGRVTITGLDDAGTPAASAVSFDLGPQQSMQINSEDLENGNAGKGLTGSLGDGTGKWRVFVTGEFSGMVVQSLNRNATDGTVTNLTDADTRGEQVLNDLFEGGGAP